MAFINSYVLILVLLLGATPTDDVPMITSVVIAVTFGANVDPIVEGTIVVTIGITLGG